MRWSAHSFPYGSAFMHYLNETLAANMNVLHCQYENALFIYPHTTHVVPNPYAFILNKSETRTDHRDHDCEAPEEKHLTAVHLTCALFNFSEVKHTCNQCKFWYQFIKKHHCCNVSRPNLTDNKHHKLLQCHIHLRASLKGKACSEWFHFSLKQIPWMEIWNIVHE